VYEGKWIVPSKKLDQKKGRKEALPCGLSPCYLETLKKRLPSVALAGGRLTEEKGGEKGGAVEAKKDCRI